MSFTREEVAEHSDVDDCWIIFNGDVYDLSQYVRMHPGGRWIILNHAGGDATQPYMNQLHSEVADRILKEMKIGRLIPSAPNPP